MEPKQNTKSAQQSCHAKNKVLTALLLGAAMTSPSMQQNLLLDLSTNQTLNKTNSSAFIRDFDKDEAALFIPKSRVGPNQNGPVPTAIFHGIMQNCNEPKLQEQVDEIQKGTGGHAECIEIGEGEMTTIFSPVQVQSAEACKKLRQHPIFGEQQFNIVGLSQGALIGRHIIQQCDLAHPVRNLVTLGAPNNGIEFAQYCPQDQPDNVFCDIQARINAIPGFGPYSSLVQLTLGPSNYLRVHHNEGEYLENSSFLPILNNEKSHDKMDKQKERFEQLNSMTMIKFTNDPVIHPIESAWFGQINQHGEVIPMEETHIYKHNTFGLKTLHEQERIFKHEKEGEHLQYGPEYIQQTVVPALLL